MKRGSFGKDGISPVIASVLLILLVVVLASLVFLWARGFINEQVEKFGKPIKDSCESVDFEAVVVQGDVGSKALEVANRGGRDIYYLSIKKIRGGNSEFDEFKFSVDMEKSRREDINLNMEDGILPEKIIIYPALIGSVKGKGSNKAFTCLEKGKVVNL